MHFCTMGAQKEFFERRNTEESSEYH